MFARRQPEPRYDNPANKIMNRILTYGLVAFIAYSFFTTDTSKKQEDPQQAFPGIDNEYTPVNWEKYVRIRNEVTREEKRFYMNEDYQTKLYLTETELKNLLKTAKADDKGRIALFDVMIHAH